jgi:opacity protein-like surface antigen
MSNRILFSGAFAAGLALTALAPGAAHGADLGTPYYGSPDDKVEFGSGWYIRGDLGGTQQQKIGVSDVPSFNTESTLVNPLAPSLLLNGSKSLGYDASLGAGYRFNQWFRADLIADFHQPLVTTANGANVSCIEGYQGVGTSPFTQENPVNGTCSPTNRASINSYDVLANVYVDLGTWYNVTPYVGAGAGLSFGHYATSSVWTMANGVAYSQPFTDAINTALTYQNNWNRNTSGQYYNLAWALMAGVAIDIYDHTKLDIGYRYLNLGTINTGSASLNLNSQEIRVGLRYMIDN